MKNRLINLLFFCIIYFNLFAQLLFIPKEYKKIECNFRPLFKNHRQLTHPRIGDTKGITNNWCGYVASTNLENPEQNSVTGVSGSWYIPKVSSSKEDAFSEIWVGIDGSTNGTVEQIGTSQNWENGKQKNVAWFEMYPDDPIEIEKFPVDVGDSISASVEYIQNDTFSMNLLNHTKKVYVTVPSEFTKSSNAQRSSAEWIVEAPNLNGTLPLANFGTINLGNCKTIINNVIGSINNKNWVYDSLTMASKGINKAIPSTLSRSGLKFSVKWEHQ